MGTIEAQPQPGPVWAHQKFNELPPRGAAISATQACGTTNYLVQPAGRFEA